MELHGGLGGGAREPAHVAVSLGVLWTLSPAPALPPGHHVVRASSCVLSLFLVLSLFVAPTAVLAAVELSHAYLLLFLGQVVIAVGALEWSWLAFRIRRKLLFTISVRDDFLDDDGPQQGLLNGGGQIAAEQGQRIHGANGQEQEQDQQEQEQEDDQDDNEKPVTTLLVRRRREMRASHCAVTKCADRYCGGKWFIVAFGVALCSAAAGLAVAYLMDRDVFSVSNGLKGRRMLVGTTVGGLWLSVFLGCLAPSKVDVVVLAMYMSCFIASSMNTFLMYYADAIGASELLDPLFVVLVGACSVFLLRVVTSKLVMASLFAVMFDILGLVMVVAPMLLAADFVAHPGAEKHRVKLALFFLVVFASEVGRWLTQVLKKTRASPLQALLRMCRCRRRQNDDIISSVDHALKNEAISSSHVEELLGAVMLGTLMIPLSLVWGHNESIGITEAVMLIASMGLGQWSRFFMVSVKQMAEVTTTGFYLPADATIGGVLDRMAVLLVAVVVFHPYAKHVIYT
ncbi:hypothetical protein Gpo141_00000804 [Globisporangium polare]